MLPTHFHSFFLPSLLYGTDLSWQLDRDLEREVQDARKALLVYRADLQRLQAELDGAKSSLNKEKAQHEADIARLVQEAVCREQAVKDALEADAKAAQRLVRTRVASIERGISKTCSNGGGSVAGNTSGPSCSTSGGSSSTAPEVSVDLTVVDGSTPLIATGSG